MAKYDVSNPTYSNQIRKFETSDKAHADLFNHVVEALVNNDEFLRKIAEQQLQMIQQHIANTNKVDNTSDMEKPVSTAQQAALDTLHAQLAAYTDKAVADLINGAPSTLDTLGEIAKAMEENADVVSALNDAIGKKANEAEFDSHVKDTTAHVTAAERESWNSKLSTAGGTVSGSIDVAGVVNAGGKAKIWTDNEGGNLLLIAPDKTRWEADAVDGNLRIFTYANDVKVGLTINKYGQIAFPNGAWSDLFHGTLYGSVITRTQDDKMGTHISAEGFYVDLPAESGYAGGLTWYQGSTAVGCIGYYKPGGYHYVGTNHENPEGELRTGVIRAGSNVHIKYPHALYVRHIEGADGGNIFLNYNQPNIAVAVGDTGNRVGGTGILLAGARASIWTDSEGGNMSIVSPNGVEYQMDVINDTLRWYRHLGDNYKTLLSAGEDGVACFPGGIRTSVIQGLQTGASASILIKPCYDDLSKGIKIGYESLCFTVCPYSDRFVDLGVGSKRWGNIYAATSVISTSDENLKKNITPLDENLTKSFIMGLNPISYTKTDGESGRTHYGLGAQSVEKLMEELGMTSMDFAGLIKSPMYEEYESEEEVEVEKLISNENGKPIPQNIKEIQKVTKQREIPGEYRYGLRYEEFIAPTIKFCQMLQDQVDDLKIADKRRQEEMNTLKAENQELKDRLAKVEKMLGI